MDILNVGHASGRPMELLLESDDEEASLLEEMEQQETNAVFKPNNVLAAEASDMPVFGGLQLRKSSDLCEVDNLLQAHMNGSAAYLVENEQFIEYAQQSFIQRLYSSNPIKEEPLDSATVDKLGETQILQLDISENDLIAAKSAFTSASILQSQIKKEAPPGTSLTPHFLNLDGVPGGLVLGEHTVFGHDIAKLPATNNNRKNRRSETKKRAYKKRNCMIQDKKGINRRIHPNMIKKIPLKTLPPENILWQEQDIQDKARKQDASNGIAKSIEGSSEVLSPEVHFCCHFCKLKYPLTKESIPDIINHMNPPDRYNQVLKIPRRLSSLRENIKMSVLVAKDKSKAQVQLVSRVECSSCNWQFLCNIENSEAIVVHYYMCQKNWHSDKAVVCLFCNEVVPRIGVRKHLHCKSTRRCKKVDVLTLQLMSSVCENYAQQHQPICVVCNEKNWPYKGHRSELEPVCESCRLNITSGNTTELVQREVTGCAICGLNCANKFVTYWASEMESLFIGESCIKKLKKPIPRSEEITAAKATNLHTLIERTLSSVTIRESSENNHNIPRLAPNILSQCEDSNLIFSSHSLVDNRNMQAATNHNMFADSPNQGKVAKGGLSPMVDSFKILHSNTSLPFVSLAPSLRFSDSKESEEKMDTESTSSVGNINANAPVINLKDLEGEVHRKSNLRLKLDVFPLKQASNMDKESETKNIGTKLAIFSLEQASNMDKECETKNMGTKFQGNASRITYCKTEKYPSIANCKKMAKVYAQQQPASKGINVKAINFKVIASTRSKLNTNTLSTVSSSQPSVTEIPVSSKSFSSVAVSKAVLNVATDPLKSKYVIKYATASGGTSSNETENVSKECIVIKTSSGTPLPSSTVKSPRLGQVIKTNRIVCGDDLDETKAVGSKHKTQIISTKKVPEIVILD